MRLVTAGGTPVTGALVGLLDASGGVVTEGISSEAGGRTLRAPAGSYRVRVRRIGFRPFISAPTSVPRTDELVLRIESEAVALKSVVVMAESRCQRIDRDLEAVGIVWEEIAKALNSSQLTSDDLAGVGKARTYQRLVDGAGVILSSDSALREISGKRPFGAINPATLATLGYVQGDMRRGWEYFAPDETVFLSNEFAATHCFRLVREKERKGRIGLAFKPIPRRKVSDIAGVLWVDEATSELREMTFQFVNAGVIDQFEAGGFTRFRRMASGAWLVDEWQLRMPRLEVRPDERDRVVAIAYQENGGGIVAGRRDAVEERNAADPASR